MASSIQTFPIARDTNSFQPSPLYKGLREESPVTTCKLFDGKKAWLLTKHKDITSALSSAHLSADRRSDGFPEIHAGGIKAKEQRPTFVNLDNPAHDEQRLMLEPWFTESAVKEMLPMIAKTVDQKLDSFEEKLKAAKGPIDLIQHFAADIPTQIVLKILGVPNEGVALLSRDEAVLGSTSRTAAEQKSGGAEKYMAKLVDSRIKQFEEGGNTGASDVISTLVRERYAKGELNREDVVNLSMLVLTAGNAAIVNSIGLGVITLLKNPEQLRTLKEDSTLAPRAVIELMRYNTASGLNSRRCAKEDVEVNGHKIRKGEAVICAVQSGDRDEAMLKNADKFDLKHHYKREDVLGFGYGVHRCQAEWLSTAELEAVFSKLFTRLPNLALATNDAKDLDLTDPKQNIGVNSLLVKLI